MGYCRNCGNKLNPTSKFCSNCGEQVVGDNMVKSQKKSNNRGKSGISTIWWVIMSIVALLLVGTLFHESNPNETNDVETNTTLPSELNTKLIDELILHFRNDGIIGEIKHYKQSVVRDEFGDKLIGDCTYESEKEGQMFSFSIYQFKNNEELKNSLQKSKEEHPFVWEQSQIYINDCMLMDIGEMSFGGVVINNNEIRKKIASSFKSFIN
ncbi:zinc ribbon domain-containing protein [Maribellus sp. CM-23]|uniref:zinc-ribbon domain-containing protein n=1 Tax=Maribellus sp. CM-23 TaxID=2781026 RepID=UPI001F20DE8B|nr:zinc ribbon domain-containing protein [Maribellus sp. CM-23]MCE4566024.1 zinc ribbon domain-containing protein [Maribellus sp. CM-23]